MDDLDFERIEKLFLKLSADFDNKLDRQSEDFGNKLEQQSENFDKKLKLQSDELRRGFGAEFEDFQDKLELVVEGRQMVAEKLEATRSELKEEIQKVDHRLTSVEARLVIKIDNMAAELSAHRKDTEAHHGVYRVKED